MRPRALWHAQIWTCQPYLLQKTCYPDDSNERTFAQNQLAVIRLEAYLLDQLAAYQQACLATSE